MGVLAPNMSVDRASLQPLIDQFRKGLAQQRKSLWVQADAAAAIWNQAGFEGIDILAAEVGLSAKWCRELAQVALQFPAATRKRYAALPMTYFREAIAATRDQPENSPASNPEFWLAYTVQHGLKRDSLRFAARHWAPPIDSEVRSTAARDHRLVLRLHRADAARARITTLVGLYNRMFSGLTGMALSITERTI